MSFPSSHFGYYRVSVRSRSENRDILTSHINARYKPQCILYAVRYLFLSMSLCSVMHMLKRIALDLKRPLLWGEAAFFNCAGCRVQSAGFLRLESVFQVRKTCDVIDAVGDVGGLGFVPDDVPAGILAAFDI